MEESPRRRRNDRSTTTSTSRYIRGGGRIELLAEISILEEAEEIAEELRAAAEGRARHGQFRA